MELKDIASVSGKPGLFKIIKPARAAMILETLDEKKQKLIISGNNRVSILKEISIYTTSKEGTFPLEDAVKAIFTKYGEALPVTSSSSESELYSFIEEFIPDYDKERVYPSDLRKLVAWYKILTSYAPEILKGDKEGEEVN